MHDNNVENSENTPKEQHRYAKLYNIIDWIDFGLIIAIVVYWVRPQTFDFFPNIALGLIFGFTSLAVSIAGIIVSTLLYKHKINKSKVRLIIRYIIWGIWIPLDIWFIVLMFAGAA